MEIIRIVEQSEVGVVRTLKELGIAASTFYNWYAAYRDRGCDGLAPVKRQQRRFWNQVPPWEVEKVVQIARTCLPESWRILSLKNIVILSLSLRYTRILKSRGLVTSPAYMLIRASDSFNKKTTTVNQMWQTDFTYLKVVGWGWYYLSTVLDDYSRYIISWELCSSMTSKDAQRSIEQALRCTELKNKNPPRLLSDNGSCYISSNLAGLPGKYRDGPYTRRSQSSSNSGEDRKVSSFNEECD